MNSTLSLAAVNFFVADVGGGLGSFLSIWLSQVAGWNTGQIGWIIAIGSLTGAVFAPAAGAFIDHLGKPRLMLAIGTGLILGGTALLLPFRAFWIVLIAQMIVSTGGAFGGPSISGLTLSIVGKKGYPKQQGVNEAANHAGNLAAAGLIAMLSWIVGPVAAVLVLGLMACATLGTLFFMGRDQVSSERMRGRGRPDKGERRAATKAVATDRRIWTVLAVVLLFQMGNSAMLPLLGQRVVHEGGGNATSWMSACVIVVSLTMIPMALFAGSRSDRRGRRWMLLFACCVVVARCALATVATGRYWLIPIEILDGIGAASFSVTMPLAIADLTYGGGRTQTTMGTMAMLQAGGAALAGVVWGYAAGVLGFSVTFGAMAIPPLIAIFLLLRLVLAESEGQSAAATEGASGKAAAMSAAA